MDEPPSHTLFLQGTILAITAVFLLAIVSAFVSASEAAFFSLREGDLNTLRRSSKEKDQSVLRLLENTHLLLLTCMTLNLFSKVAIVTISTLLIWDTDITNNSLAFTFFLTTLALLVFGDLVARIYATKTNFRFAQAITASWNILINVLKPITIPIMRMREGWEKRFEEKKSAGEELIQAFELASEAAETTESDKEILRGIVNFGTLNVRQVMRTRLEIAAVNTEANFDELLDAVNKSGYSRIPVFSKTIDTIEGVLYTKDLLPFLGYPANFIWHKLLRPAFVIPETKKIDLLLKDFQEKRVHIAIVRDERGNTLGLVTLEDLIEEIIGDINDEFDEVDNTLQTFQERTLRSDGINTLTDFVPTRDVDPKKFGQMGMREQKPNRETENQPRESGHA